MKITRKKQSGRKSTTTTEYTKGGVFFLLFFDCQNVKLSFNQNKPLASSETKKKKVQQ